MLGGSTDDSCGWRENKRADPKIGEINAQVTAEADEGNSTILAWFLLLCMHDSQKQVGGGGFILSYSSWSQSIIEAGTQREIMESIAFMIFHAQLASS